MEQVASLLYYIGTGVTLFNLTLHCFISIRYLSPVSAADTDPGSGAFLNPWSEIRDGKKIRIRNHFDPGSGIREGRIRATNSLCASPLHTEIAYLYCSSKRGNTTKKRRRLKFKNKSNLGRQCTGRIFWSKMLWQKIYTVNLLNYRYPGTGTGQSNPDSRSGAGFRKKKPESRYALCN
jgi:hypothetical protein